MNETADLNPNGISNADFLTKLILSFKERMVSFSVVPQMDGRWLVIVEVPTVDGTKNVHFMEPVLEWALEKALDEYDQRLAARRRLF